MRKSAHCQTERGSDYLLLELRALLRCVEVVRLQVVVADDVVVSERVPLRPEVPRLILWVFGLVLVTFQLVVEVYDVEVLLVTQRAVLGA